MERSKECKICNKRFASGKAIGGHMRTHFTKLDVVVNRSATSSIPKTHQQQRSRDKPDRNTNPDPRLHENGASDTELSPRRRTRSRSMHRGGPDSKKNSVIVFAVPAFTDLSRDADVEPERATATLGSVSAEAEIMSKEEAALCLMVLSRDKLPEEEQAKGEAVGGGGSGSEEGSLLAGRAGSSKQPEYRCHTSKKGFGSYRALGGHRGSHNPNKKISADSSAANVCVASNFIECPYCDKVFDSGQALGGHKKVHQQQLLQLSGGTNANANDSDHKKTPWLDLNLPAPEADDKEETTSK